ncbi:MAG: cobalamin B12-binding domain-containing protein [Acidobacteriota bacterium]
MRKRIRVYIATPCLDGHDMAAKLMTFVLRDAGMEVVYGGLRQRPEVIANAAIQEDVDVIGISSHSGFHMPAFTKVLNVLRQQDATNILLTGGGVIPQQDVEMLTKLGVGRLFPPNTTSEEIISYVTQEVEARRSGVA